MTRATCSRNWRSSPYSALRSVSASSDSHALRRLRRADDLPGCWCRAAGALEVAPRGTPRRGKPAHGQTPYGFPQCRPPAACVSPPVAAGKRHAPRQSASGPLWIEPTTSPDDRAITPSLEAGSLSTALSTVDPPRPARAGGVRRRDGISRSAGLGVVLLRPHVPDVLPELAHAQERDELWRQEDADQQRRRAGDQNLTHGRPPNRHAVPPKRPRRQRRAPRPPLRAQRRGTLSPAPRRRANQLTGERGRVGDRVGLAVERIEHRRCASALP
jgi:hypothetical protein